MADFVYNGALGKIAEYGARVNTNDPTNAVLVVVLLKAAGADATLKDLDTLADVLAEASTDEADFTNYARKVLDQTSGITITVDDTNDRADVDIPNQVWLSAGGAVNNTLTDAIVCYDPDSTAGTDATIVPLVQMDATGTTNGNDVTLNLTTAYFLRAL